MSVPSAPGRLPLLGHALALLRDPIALLQSIRAHGDIVAIRIGPLDVYVLNAPELVRQILVADADRYRKGRFYEKFRPYQGDGLFTVDGQRHQKQRRLLSPAFQRARLAAYAEVMRACAEQRSARWRPHAALDVRAEMYALAGDVVARVLFGSGLDTAGTATIHRWLPVFITGMGRRVVSPAAWLDRIPTPANRRFDESRRRLHTVVGELIAAHRPGGPDLLGLLLQARDDDGTPMDPAQVRDEVLTFLTAGIETVSTTLTWLYHELGRHPQVERRLLAERDEVLGERPVTFDDLPRLAYCRDVVRETLRLHSPAWMLMRRPVEPVQLGGVRFAAGTELLCSPATLHRDPALYPRPTQFDPDRWAQADRRAPAYLPFSAGPYRCLGEQFALTELVTVVATIGARWRLAPARDRAPREVAGAALAPDRLRMVAVPRPSDPGPARPREEEDRGTTCSAPSRRPT